MNHKTWKFFLPFVIAVIGFGFIYRPAHPADGDLVLPNGFSAETVIDSIGNNRHIVVNKNGDIYVKLGRLKDGKGIFVLRKINGVYQPIKSFGNYTGTGIAIKNGFLFASSDNAIFRYRLNEKNEVMNPDNPERIVMDLLSQGTHASKSIALDNKGKLYVNIGAPSNACQVKDRASGSPGQDPCPLLEKAGGIWQFNSSGKDQSYNEGIKYATGLRNVVGLDWNAKEDALYVMQHGRDQLSTLFPNMFNNEQSADLPAEEFFKLKKGSDAGWPFCYYDGFQKKKLLAPEFGGDGKKQARCADKEQPIMAFPAHWGPNAVLFYTGNMFPDRYKNGVFIAFHGSWNRAPLPQGGYNVIFVQFAKGKPSGNYELFATGFPGKETVTGPAQAKYRPCGLAQGPDGALYISDSRKGKIWKIVYKK